MIFQTHFIFRLNKISKIVASCILIAAGASANAAQFGDLELSGFGRLVAGHLNQDTAVFNGYSDSISLGEDSLVALRADYSFSESLSFVGQAIGHTGETRESGIQWLYADYRPTSDLSFKIGRQRVPFYNYSDIVDVGFAYPNLRLPDAVYSTYLFSEFDGVLGRYDYSTPYLSGAIEGYYGYFEGDVFAGGDRVDVDVEGVFGILATMNIEQWSFRASYQGGDVDVVNDELLPLITAFEQSGFANNARSLEIKGDVRFWQLSAAYETIDYFVRAEFTQTTAGDELPLVPSVDAYSISLGYNFYPFTAHLTFSTNDVSYANVTNEIPFGIAPQLDQLAFVYDGIFASRPIDEISAVALGLRYDWSANIALKVEVSALNGSEGGRAYFDVIDPGRTKQKGLLTQFAVEWVF